MRKVLMAAGAILSLAMASAANATVTVGSTNLLYTETTAGNQTDVSYHGAVSPPSFTRYLDFTDSLSGLYDVTLTTAGPTTDFTSALICLGTLQCTSGTAVGVLSEIVDSSSGEYWALNGLNLAAGTYSLWITGTVHPRTAVGGLGGDIFITAVPEPATWAMMLLGFLGVGFAVSRRRKTVPALLQLA